MNPAPPPFHPPVAPPEKKGLSGLAWTGIGCGTLLLITLGLAIGGGFILFKKVKDFAANPEKTAAELIISSHPELQKLSSDDKAGEITIKTATGEILTVSYKDIAQGKFSYKDANGVETRLGGSGNIDDVPAWVPRTPQASGTPSVYNSVRDGKTSGLYTVETSATPHEIESHFVAEADKLGFTTRGNSSMHIGSTKNLSLTYSDGTRSLTVNIGAQAGKPTSVTVAYQEN